MLRGLGLPGGFFNRGLWLAIGFLLEVSRTFSGG